MTKAKLLDKIPVAIEYKHLPLLHTKADLEQAILKLQGEPVEFSAGNSTPVLMSAFNELRKFCPEIVFHVGEIRQRYIIFDNEAVPVLRPDDVVELKENSGLLESAKPKKELTIDLGKIWTKNQEKYLTIVLEKCLNDFKDLFKPAIKLILAGDAPAILFLLAQNIASPDCQEIYYQKDNSKLIRVK
jgi:hypothetical protein